MDPKFSSFVKSMVVEIQRDQSLYGESSLVEVRSGCGGRQNRFLTTNIWNAQWRKDYQPLGAQAAINGMDGFEIRRRGDENVDVRILLTLDYNPERFKVAAPLAKLLAITAPESKAGLVNKLWQYIKTQKLLDAEDKRLINLDDDLQQVGFEKGD